MKRPISIGTILIVLVAFSAGVAVWSYFGSIVSQNQVISTFTSVSTLATTITPTLETTSQTSVSLTSSTALYSSSTSTKPLQTSTGRPIWISSNTNVISYSQAGSYVGQTRTVEGTIVNTHKSGSNVFLDFHYPYQGYFYIYIPSSVNFKFAPESFYLNKQVRVTGTIVLYKGSPEIIVNTPSQIEVAYMGFNYP